MTGFVLESQMTCLAHFIEFPCVQCLCNKICFHSLRCPLSVQNYHKLKRIHVNIVQNLTFLGRLQTFGGQCICVYIILNQIYNTHIKIYILSFLHTKKQIVKTWYNFTIKCSRHKQTFKISILIFIHAHTLIYNFHLTHHARSWNCYVSFLNE